jgi:hypothetical protein
MTRAATTAAPGRARVAVVGALAAALLPSSATAGAGPPPTYALDTSWPALPAEIRLVGTTAVAVVGGEVFIANHGPPKV